MAEELLRLLHLRIKKDHIVYFSDLSFHLRRHEVLGLTYLSPEQRKMLLQYFSGTLLQAEGQLFAHGHPVYAPFTTSLTRTFYCISSSSTLVRHMSITENLFVLSTTKRESVIIRRHRLDIQCQALIEQFGLQLDARTPVDMLTSFGRIAVELLKAIVSNAQVIFYDRSLDTLTEREFEHFQTLIQSIRASGRSVVLLCGQPERMLPLCSRVVTVKDGSSIKSLVPCQASASLIRQITSGISGDSVHAIEPAANQEDALLHVRGLRLRNTSHPLDLTVARGEIICLIDYASTDADQILQALYGLRPFSCYHYTVCGRLMPTMRPDLSFANGMFLIRHLESMDDLLPNASVQDNISLPLLQLSASGLGLIRQRFLNLEIRDAAEQVGLSLNHLSSPLSSNFLLRVQLARILLSHRSVLLLENPFNGLDPSDAYLLQHFFTNFAAAGNCVLLSTTHLTGVSRFCTHYYQVADGKLLEEKSPHVQ